jgi:beta-lactamase regulating signal transducer with metallopeptidase domain
VLVLLKLVTPPLWSVEFPVIPSSPSAVERDDSMEFLYAPTLIDVVPFGEPSFVMQELDAVPDRTISESMLVAGEPDTAAGSPDSRRAILTVWGLGTLAWVGITWRRVRRFQSLLREARPAASEVQAMTDALSVRIGLPRSPIVSMLPGSLSPFVWSLGGPARLFLPEGLWNTLDQKRRATLLTHELAHLRRRDHWVRVLEGIAVGLYWWNPLVYWARRGLREAEEQCCDAWVVKTWPGAAKAYASALLDTIDFLSEAGAVEPLPVLASGLGHIAQFKRKLHMIMNQVTQHRLGLMGRLTLAALGVALLPLAPSFGRADDTKEAVASSSASASTSVAAAGASSTGIFLLSGSDDSAAKAHEQAASREENRAKALLERVRVEQKRAEVVRESANRAAEAKAKAQEIRARVIRGSAGEKSKLASKEDAAALDKARAELREAEAVLEKAARRVAELQMKLEGRGSVVSEIRIEGKSDDSKTFHRVDASRTVDIIGTEDGRKFEVKALPAGKEGAVRIFSRVVEGKPGKEVEVVVEDEGAGKKGMTPRKLEAGEVQVFRIGEGKPEMQVEGKVIVSDGKEIRTITIPAPPMPPGALPRVQEEKSREDRIELLEKQLQKLTEELRSMKKK